MSARQHVGTILLGVQVASAEGKSRQRDFSLGGLGIRDRRPWFLVEVKLSETKLHAPLYHFQAQTGAAHAFQVVWQEAFVAADPFTRRDPCVVPARTLLSQLL